MASGKQNAVIYLDNAATTPVHPQVAQAMLRALQEDYGNPSSRHAMGLAAERVLRGARREVAARVRVDSGRVLFTSGATEANALAILGMARRQRRPGRVLISAIEHPSVLATTRMLEEAGHQVELIPVEPGGWVDPERVAEMLDEATFLVAVMHVNNETGIIQPVCDVAQAVRRVPSCRLLVDAVQSFGRLPLDLPSSGADLMTFSAHKIGGPKGAACLVRSERAALAPLWGGGEQEQGLRPGTENLPGIVGLAAAVELQSELPSAREEYAAPLVEAALARHPDAHVIGDRSRRAAHILSLAIPKVKSEVLINLLEAQGVCASSGSACHSRRSLRSHVLEAMGVPLDHGIVRFSFGPQTTREDIERAADALGSALSKL
jgi:cysteine desulfurase